MVMGFDVGVRTDDVTARLRAAGLGRSYREKEATLWGLADDVARWLRDEDGYNKLRAGRGLRVVANTGNVRAARRVLNLVVRAAVLDDVDCRVFSSPVALLQAMDRESVDDLYETQVLAVDQFQLEGDCPLTRREVVRVQDLLLDRDEDGRALLVASQIGATGPFGWWPDATRELVEDLKAFRV